DYVHRIGRTGRAGAEGEAVSLVSPDESGLLRDIERLIRREIPRETIAGFELDPNARNEPDVDDRPQRQSRRPMRGDASRGAGPRQGGSRGQGAYAPSRGQGAAQGAPSPRGASAPQAQRASAPAQRGPATPAQAARTSTAIAAPAPAAPARPAGVGGFRGRPSRSGR